MADENEQKKPIGKNSPPVKNQFKKREPSRNPYGRPTKRCHPVGERQIWKDFIEAGERRVPVRQGAKTVTKPAMAAIYDQLFAKALQGEPWAMRRVVDMRLQMFRDYEASHERMIAAIADLEQRSKERGIELTPEVLKIIAEFRRRLERPGDELFDF